MMRSKTKQKLIQSFFYLIENNHYSSISVTDLISEAGCSRTTFYRHYTDIIDMYNKICEDILKAILGELIKSFKEEKSDLGNTFENFCKKLDSQKKYIQLLTGENGGRRFFEIALDIIFKYAYLINPFLDETQQSVFRFVACSGIGTYVQCIMNGADFDIHYLDMYIKILSNVKKDVVINDTD